MEWTEAFVLERFRDNHSEAPCFVYVHINDTHEPWDAPEPWRNMWGNSYHNLYEGDITYTDHYIGRIFSGLKKMGIFDNMLIVVFGDHGTEFWEHGFIEKKVNLYNEILHVPLIFYYPGILPGGFALHGLCESTQVAPTILDIAGLPPMSTAQGKSLLPRINGTESKGLDFVCSHTRHEHHINGGPVQFDHYAIHTQRHKFIRLELHVGLDELFGDWKYRMQAIAVRCRISPDSLKAGSVMRELYDLQFDPKEGRNLLVAGGENIQQLAQSLEQKLDSWIDACK